MLDEYKKQFETQAAAINNWRTISKNVLCNKYIEFENTDNRLAEAYFSAIVLRYWSAIDKYYYQSFTSATVEDCYDWLIHAILYALKSRKWTDPDNKLYNDPNAPDKVINRCIKSTRLIHYQMSNRQRRKVNYNMTSLDALEEEFADSFIPVEVCQDITDISFDDYIKSTVKDAFVLKNYFLAFVIDGIINTDCFIQTEENSIKYVEFSAKKLSKHLRSISDDYCKSFSTMYDISLDDVLYARTFCVTLSAQRIKTKLQKVFDEMKKKYQA